MRILGFLLSMLYASFAFAQTKVETYKGDWNFANGNYYMTCTFEIENQTIKQQCGSNALRTVKGAKFSGNTITFSKILVGTSDEGYTVLKKGGNTLRGEYFRTDGRPGPTGIFVKQ